MTTLVAEKPTTDYNVAAWLLPNFPLPAANAKATLPKPWTWEPTGLAPVCTPDHVPYEWTEDTRRRDDNKRIAAKANAAADYIEKHGWCQGGWRTDDGKACALGALIMIGVEDYSSDFHALNMRAREITGRHSVPDWNDAKGRTAADVIGMWRDVAKSFATAP